MGSGPSLVLVLLGVGLLQQGAPEFPPLSRVDEQQLPVFDRQAVVDHHVHPLPELPELPTRSTMQPISLKSVLTV